MQDDSERLLKSRHRAASWRYVESYVPEAPAFSVNPQSPSPAMLSMCVISGSAAIKFLHARSIASVNRLLSGNETIELDRSTAVALVGGGTASCAEGGDFEDHFHPGAFVSSSKRSRIRVDEGL